jgi:hypothetical protein
MRLRQGARRRHARGDAHRLPGHISGLFAAEEAHHARQAVFRAGSDVGGVHADAFASQLLAQRATEAFNAARRGGVHRIAARIRQRRGNQNAAVAGDAAHDGMEGVVQRPVVGGRTAAGGVHHHNAGLLAFILRQRGRHAGAGFFQRAAQGLRSVAAAGRQQQRGLTRKGLRLVAAGGARQRHGFGQTQRPREGGSQAIAVQCFQYVAHAAYPCCSMR